MYQYEFERISTDITGWRYVGFLPAAQRGDGYLREMDLVFEREV